MYQYEEQTTDRPAYCHCWLDQGSVLPPHQIQSIKKTVTPNPLVSGESSGQRVGRASPGQWLVVLAAGVDAPSGNNCVTTDNSGLIDKVHGQAHVVWDHPEACPQGWELTAIWPDHSGMML